MERRSTTTLGNQPPLPSAATPFSFSFRVVYRGIEDGKPATVRELTTFFRFSREMGEAAGVAGGWEEKMGRGWQKPERARPSSRSYRAREREETPTKGLRQVMMYRGKFPAENYTQTRPADLPLKGNRLPFFLMWLARVKLTYRLAALRIALKEIGISLPP